ncbi:MAG: hypothetical protein GXY03_13740 [Solirubrobacterales bacterium]|nr:hypothetical protein [Solirubrobacterales bacterium]
MRRLLLVAAASALLAGAGCDSELTLRDAQTTAAPPATSPELPSGATLDAAETVLRTSDGRRLPVDPQQVTGYIDSAVLNGDYVDISGWAAPADLSRAAAGVVALVDRRSVASAVPDGARPDLVEGYDRPGLASAGFAMSIPRSRLRCTERTGGLQILAATQRAAGQLEWLDDSDAAVRSACQEGHD